MRRIVTVSGENITEPKNLKVRIGTSHQEILQAVGGFKKQPEKVISGGPMMGLAMFDLNVPIIKTTGAVLGLSKNEMDSREESNCIRCGKCVEACPMFLLPLDLDKYARHKDEDHFVASNGLDCIECGACTYVCPSKRHLVHSIRTTKRTIMAKRRK